MSACSRSSFQKRLPSLCKCARTLCGGQISGTCKQLCTHKRLRESKVSDNFVLFPGGVVCFLSLWPLTSTSGVNEYTLHASISTYGPNKNNFLTSTSDHFSCSGCCSRLIQLLYFPFTLPSTVNISTTWPPQSRLPQKGFQHVTSQVGLDRNGLLLVVFATYFSFSQELWSLPSPLFCCSSFFVVFSCCSIITVLCLCSCLLSTWLPVLPI